MALNLSTASGEYTPYLKFNGKAGRWYTKGEGEGDEEYEVMQLTAVFDLAQIKTGWITFAEGSAPEYLWDIDGQRQPKPGGKAKQGFALTVFSPKTIGGVRELASNSNGMIAAIQALYQAWEAAPESKLGKLPVVSCTQVLPVKNKYGTNYQPVLSIVKWVERPAEMPIDAAAATGNKAANGGSHVPPPRQVAPAPAAATAATASDTDY